MIPVLETLEVELKIEKLRELKLREWMVQMNEELMPKKDIERCIEALETICKRSSVKGGLKAEITYVLTILDRVRLKV